MCDLIELNEATGAGRGIEWRLKALQEHPDKGGDPEKFKKINEAYAILSDDQKRAAYDRMGKAGVDGSMPNGMGEPDRWYAIWRMLGGKKALPRFR